MKLRRPRLTGKMRLTLHLRLMTGMRIGGSDPGLAIGAIDLPVVRDPISHEPIIPGSSLKGKIRSLLEKITCEYEIITKKDSSGRIIRIITKHGNDPDSLTGSTFGVAADKSLKTISSESMEEEVIIPTHTRLFVRDGFLTEKSRQQLERSKSYLDTEFAEVKVEIGVDRLTGGPQHGNLRQVERVPKGAEFECEIVLDFWDVDLGEHSDIVSALKDKSTRASKMVRLLALGLQLLECDYLGGSGSRGYGKVKVCPGKMKILQFNPETLSVEPVKELEQWDPEVLPFSSLVYPDEEKSIAAAKPGEPKAIEQPQAGK